MQLCAEWVCSSLLSPRLRPQLHLSSLCLYLQAGFDLCLGLCAVGSRSPVRSVPEGMVAPFLGLPWWAGRGLQSLLSSLCQAAAPTVLAEAWPGCPLQGSQSLLTESWWAMVSIGSSKEGICDKVCQFSPKENCSLGTRAPQPCQLPVSPRLPQRCPV